MNRVGAAGEFAHRLEAITALSGMPFAQIGLLGGVVIQPKEGLPVANEPTHRSPGTRSPSTEQAHQGECQQQPSHEQRGRCRSEALSQCGSSCLQRQFNDRQSDWIVGWHRDVWSSGQERRCGLPCRSGVRSDVIPERDCALRICLQKQQSVLTIDGHIDLRQDPQAVTSWRPWGFRIALIIEISIRRRPPSFLANSKTRKRASHSDARSAVQRGGPQKGPAPPVNQPPRRVRTRSAPRRRDQDRACSDVGAHHQAKRIILPFSYSSCRNKAFNISHP